MISSSLLSKRESSISLFIIYYFSPKCVYPIKISKVLVYNEETNISAAQPEESIPLIPILRQYDQPHRTSI